MLNIRPYRSCDAETILTWCNNEDLFMKWTAGIMGAYPLTAARFEAALAGRIDNDRYFPFVAMDEDKVVGFFILRRPDSTRTLRFGFVIVDPQIRGKGYGKQMLQLGMRYAFDLYGADKVTLGVFENNPSARYCYQAAGFSVLDDKTERYDINGKSWVCLEMEANRK